MSQVALIPARAGSERVAGKNIRPLAGHPLLAHTIAQAQAAGCFDAIVVSTDSEEIAEVARAYGAEVPALRPPELATSTSPDVEWVLHVLDTLAAGGRTFELYALLRPTSPFRAPGSIRAAVAMLRDADPPAESLRAVTRVREHPAKMWRLEGDRARPLLPSPVGEVPLHSRQYQALPEIYVQDSSLEVSWTRVARDGGGISGAEVLAWVSQGHEGFSIDYPDDWEAAERLVEAGAVEVVLA
ncbi:acylneuraminate cytidylyltransferase family protein [Svornostia abyssi]|uniref:Acylneuraminate cytidylyltransferase family protein n=1 Tax=Svornostia abyssi TaxID=2898438 RepID=A0ABY5PM32_9ACTN|nr:acylneuraminate cytidylyltransferase family protein [Parviterribacteraceae bacterium J379]